MANICTNCSSGTKWLPTPISTYDAYLMRFFKSGIGVQNVTGIRKNIAYNLQYLEFQIKLLEEFNITQVILTQTWKIIIIVGSGIIESILFYLLMSKNLAKKTSWNEIGKTGNEININENHYRIENVVYEKISTPKYVEMSFETMIKKAESKELLGKDHKIYEKLQYLRKLRNRVHLHLIDTENDSDWKKFNINEINTMKLVLRSFMISSLFLPTLDQKQIFNFLE